MRSTTLLPFAALAAAFVIPDRDTTPHLHLALEDDTTVRQDQVKQWWDDVSIYDYVPDVGSAGDVLDSWQDTLDAAYETAQRTAGHFWKGLDTLLDGDDEEDFAYNQGNSDWGETREGDEEADKKKHKSIYELIKESKYATKFAELVDEYDDIVEVLKDTKNNYTLFVPIDKAFEHIPHDHKPPKEFVEKVLSYHVVPGLYPAKRVLASHTFPTLLEEKSLNDNPQRLRFSVGLFGLRINYYSKLVGLNLFAKNGVIHAVDHILIPPPTQAKVLSLFPSTFSTLSLALEKTGLGAELASVPHAGGTFFAPPNGAFAALGPRLNAFLFSEHGLKYLKALLKYHVVANQTLYSDAYYGPPSGDEDEDEDKVFGGGAGRDGHYHADLPTLLDDKSLSVDIARWKGFIKITVNGYVRVATQDALAKDGVLQLVGRVLVPPQKPGGGHFAEKDDSEMSVGELKERLASLVEEEEEAVEAVDLKQEVLGEL